MAPELINQKNKINQPQQLLLIKKKRKRDKNVQRKKNVPKVLPQKEFVLRKSTLTNLWEVTHLQSVYNIFLAIFILVYLNTTIFYYFNFPKLKKHLSIVFWTFSKFHIVAVYWSVSITSVFLFYLVFKIWSNNRINFKRKWVYDTAFLLLFIIYQLSALIAAAQICILWDLPPMSSSVILAEQVRFIMKTHSFVRENVPKILNFQPNKNIGNQEILPYPSFEQLVYFLFAPTLIYRDSYPRLTSISWKFVTWNALQVFCCILATYIPFIFFLVQNLEKVGIEPVSLEQFIFIFSTSSLVGVTFMLVLFYGLWHCWSNAFAEMLRFGDRKFYDDWWTSTTIAKFFSSWNTVIYEWLHSYIYRDIYISCNRSRTEALIMVFLISAIIHEYIVSICLKFVFPLMFCMYVCSGIIVFPVSRKLNLGISNALLWILLFQSWGIMIVCYSLEWYARINCPRILDSWLDYIVPRSFTCDIIAFSS